jgi:exodeoxyribonuclease V gamma subunit
LRELEALRDRLLTALATDGTLEVHEIAVLAPDINVYAPFFDAVFGSDDPGRNLRYHVIDLDLGKENAWFRALDALLSLVSGTVDRPTLFALVDTPAFQEAWSLEPDDRDLWLDYTEEVSAWREEGPDGAPQSWSLSWDRLFMGWFRPDAVDQVAPPLDASGSAFRSLGRFHELVDHLRARGRDTRRPRAFLDWVRFLDQTTAAFLAPGEGTGAILSGRLRTLALDAGSPDEPLPWAGFRSFVQDQIAHFPGRRGQLLTEGIHCSSLRPLRSIPFRVIAILGLDEGKFPRQPPSPSFDLRRHEPHQDEVSSLALDRYSFWETLMAARDLLYLSYQGSSPVDGSPRPPSPVLADLLDYLEVAGEAWPVEQTTVKDFALPRSGNKPIWSPRTHRRALALTSGAPAPGANPQNQPGPPALDEAFPEVKTQEILLAFTAPARFYLQRVKQVVLRDEDRRGVDDEEPWSLDFLERQSWLQEGLRRRLAGPGPFETVDEFLRVQSATGRVREGVFAERDRRDLTAQLERVDAWSRQLGDQGWVPEAGGPRTRWAGRPWTGEPRDRLVRGGDVLLPRLLYSESLPARAKVEAGLKVLLAPAASARLVTLSPRGTQGELSWGLAPQATRDLATRAEAYWTEATGRPLPFYPDYLEALGDRRAKNADEPWVTTVEEGWRQVHAAHRVRSENTLTNCPFASLAFPDEPRWDSVVADLEPWWESLFVPLLEAWK